MPEFICKQTSSQWYCAMFDLVYDQANLGATLCDMMPMMLMGCEL